ncbi:uncharacterized protein LOC142322589 [Lycorma delicatula]|uniref:uncharacterized protein LOC142322589 n=1 Tax=Lycorma delicatula TaxID=130591 RepID=UPI003F5187DC
MRSRKRVIVVGDFNCRTALAGAASSNVRGRILEDLLEVTGAICVNDGAAIYSARGHESIIDLVIIDSRIRIDTIDFSVLNEETGSDHKAVSITIRDRPSRVMQININHRLTDYQIHCVTREVANKIMSCAGIDPEIFQNIIKDEIANIPKNTNRHHPVYWWSSDIEDQRRIMQRKKRIAQRLRAQTGMEEEGCLAVEEYRNARKKLNFLIKQSKKRKWQELCDDLDADPRGKAFRIITKRLGRHVPTLSNEMSAQQVRALFSREESANREVIRCEGGRFTQQEVLEAIKKLNHKKSPGPDRIPAAVVKGLGKIIPWEMVDIASYGLQNCTFPDCWKASRQYSSPKQEPTTDKKVTDQSVS